MSGGRCIVISWKNICLVFADHDILTISATVDLVFEKSKLQSNEADSA